MKNLCIQKAVSIGYGLPVMLLLEDNCMEDFDVGLGSVIKCGIKIYISIYH